MGDEPITIWTVPAKGPSSVTVLGARTKQSWLIKLLGWFRSLAS